MRRRITLYKEQNKSHADGIWAGQEYVDLGLPSGLLWANYNVGAIMETEYGNYYQYGKGAKTMQETSGQTYYYLTENPLASSADTAYKVLGTSWYTPTSAQCAELTANTTFTWETNFNSAGINGAKFTSTADTTQYIFFPAAGIISKSGNLTSDGVGAYMQTSTPCELPYSYSFYATYGMPNPTLGVGCSERDRARSVRGVLNYTPDLNILFYNSVVNKKQVFSTADLPSSEDGWAPIAIEVVPRSHNRYGDGSGGFMSLGCLTSGGTMQTPTSSESVDTERMTWGEYGRDITQLTNYYYPYIGYDNAYVLSQTNSSTTAVSYNSSQYSVAYPYTDTGETAITIYEPSSYTALCDFSGKTATTYMNSNNGVASLACSKYKTNGTSAGDWYLPSAGEIGYLPSIKYQINDTIKALNKIYGNVGLLLNLQFGYWSSSEQNSTSSYDVYLGDGKIGAHGTKTSSFYVRSFLRYKDGD